MNLLLTAFAPFQGRSVNGSQKLLEAVSGQLALPHETMTLPVEYNSCFNPVEQRLKTQRKIKHVIALGEAARESLNFECVALNKMHSSSPDNGGVVLNNERIEKGGPVALESSWGRESDSPLPLSFHAGTYVCNTLYWHLLKNEAQWKYKSCFIHCPIYKNDDETNKYAKELIEFIHIFTKGV